MSELRDLYQEIILDHSRQPRNHACPAGANREARGDNPLCGDRVTIYLTVENDVVKDVGFVGRGCAISVASASLMTEVLKGKTVAEAEALFRQFQTMVTKGDGGDGEAIELEKLEALAGVREYPMRVKCATLCWHTMAAALNAAAGAVSTEKS